MSTREFFKGELSKFSKSIRNEGIVISAWKLMRYLVYACRRLNWHRNLRKLHGMFKTSSRKTIFNYIYKKNIWFSLESRSGYGSTLKYTENVRNHISEIFNRYAIRSVYDAPCGDFNWMNHCLKGRSIRYIGADIVSDLVARCNERYSCEQIEFLCRDVVMDAFPTVDLWICRDTLIHFSFADILATFDNFCASDIKYALLSNCLNADGSLINRDIDTGHYRELDLFSAPFHFSREKIKERFLDYNSPGQSREMVLVARKDICSIIPQLRRSISERVGKKLEPSILI
jgi:hypothetical protein